MTAADRLPRGRHNLSRDEVVRTQRTRILRALAETMTERGYVDTPVAEILSRAGVSRETFYQQFASKQDCFVGALEDTIDRLAGALAPALEAPGTPLARLDRVLGDYLAFLATEPAIARLFLIETYAAGPVAMQRRLALQTRFVDGVAAIVGAHDARQRFACEAFVAAVVSLVTARFVADDVPGLARLRAPLIDLARALLPRVAP